MPQTKKAASRAATPLRAFKEPAALKRLTKSLESAQDALGQLQTQAGRDVSQGVRDIYKELKTFVSSAHRNTAKYARALQKDFERLQKGVSKTGAAGKRTRRPTRSTATRRTATRATATRQRSTARRRTAAKPAGNENRSASA